VICDSSADESAAGDIGRGVVATKRNRVEEVARAAKILT
jgi:hypothetical protein